MSFGRVRKGGPFPKLKTEFATIGFPRQLTRRDVRPLVTKSQLPRTHHDIRHDTPHFPNSSGAG